MIFTSFEFIAFFALVVLIRSCFRSLTADKWFLLIASLCFYLSWSIPFVFLILFTSITDYSIGRKIGRTVEPASRRRWLTLSLIIDISLLGFFKYGNFFVENISVVINALGWRVGPLHYNVVLPPAISFYTFASMSYVLDVYYERLAVCKSARDYALFITFFPKLLSGPIVRGIEFLPQLRERLRASAEDIEVGLAYFLVGAVKKLVIADQMAGHVSLIFSAPEQYDRLTLLQGLVGYAIQVYCDFSGYSDMAIGCARILGFRFPENFQMPFSAVTITEFWRRWHMTLSRWFRDYAFLPLEIATRGNRYPTLRVSINVIVMMLLVGLWHGPSWNFVIFGGIHGVAMATHRFWSAWKPLGSLKNHAAFRVIGNLCARLLTLGVVLLSFVFFRSQSLTTATKYLSGMLAESHHGIRLLSPYILAGFGTVLLVHLLVNKDRNLAQEIPQRSLSIRIAACTCLVLLLVSFAATETGAFIYFQF
jgi:alginate O-acetyltransferase complex protein AlgI